MPRLQADLLLFLIAVIWGLAFLFQKSAMAHVGPLTFIAARAAVAAAVLAPLAWREARRERRAPHGRGSARLLRIGAAGGAAFFAGAWLQQAGIVTATVTNAGFLTVLYVVITPFIAWALDRERPSRSIAVGVVLAAGGAWLLGGGGSLGAIARGDALIAASAAFWALHVVVSRRAARLDRPFGFSALQFAVVAVAAALGAGLFEAPTMSGLAAAAREILFVGLLSSALTFTVLTIALKHVASAEAAIITSLETVIAAIAGFVLLDERLSMIGWTGAALMFSATLLVQLHGVAGRGKVREPRD